jgi:hypothetical protein
VDVAAIVVNALYIGLVQQRRVAPESVPDQLFDSALRWLFAGISATCAELPPTAGRVEVRPAEPRLN